MWNLMNKINTQNRNRFIDRVQTDSCQSGMVLGSWVKKMKVLSKEKNLIDTDNSMVITRGKGGWGEVEEGKEGINGDEKRLGLG